MEIAKTSVKCEGFEGMVRMRGSPWGEVVPGSLLDLRYVTHLAQTP